MNRQPAKRIFADEFNRATYEFTDESAEGDPSFVLLPTGQRAHRVWISGTLLERSDIGNGEEYWQARLGDASGVFWLYGRPQYQTRGVRQLKQLDPPATVSVVGQVHTYDPNEQTTYVSVEPETVTGITSNQRDQWGVETAVQTLFRVENCDPESNDDAALAVDQYPETDPEEFAELAKTALSKYSEKEQPSQQDSPAVSTQSPPA